MKAVSVYCKTTGLIKHHITANDDDDLKHNIPADHAVIDGHHDPRTCKVDLVTGAIERHSGADPVAMPVHPVLDARRRIHALDQRSIRVLRELALGYDGARQRLKDIDDEMQLLRGKVNGSATD